MNRSSTSVSLSENPDAHRGRYYQYHQPPKLYNKEKGTVIVVPDQSRERSSNGEQLTLRPRLRLGRNCSLNDRRGYNPRSSTTSILLRVQLYRAHRNLHTWQKLPNCLLSATQAQ